MVKTDVSPVTDECNSPRSIFEMTFRSLDRSYIFHVGWKMSFIIKSEINYSDRACFTNVQTYLDIQFKNQPIRLLDGL